MQGELYTERPFGEYGLQRLNRSKLLGEMPDYVVFNGAVEASRRSTPCRRRSGKPFASFLASAALI